MSRAQKLLLGLVGALACAGYLLLSRDIPSEQLRSLQADALAAYAPSEGRLAKSSQQNEGSTFGKPTRARLSRLFTLPPGDPKRQLERAVAAARASGWKITAVDTNRSLGALVAIGDKELEGGRAQMSITVYVDDTLLRGEVKSPALKVSLEHLG